MIWNFATALLLATSMTHVPSSELCDPGVWDVVSKNHVPGQPLRPIRATSTVTCLLDGRLEVAEYRAFAPDGTVVFRGVSFHAWEPEREKRTTLWAMLGDPGHTVLVEHMEDDELLSEGDGRDLRGTFQETSTTTFDDEGGYRFEMNRTYDGGATWIEPFNVIEAVKLADRAPEPTPLTKPTREAKQAAGVSSKGAPLLDGLAEVETRTETAEGHTRRFVRFSARYARPDRWRTLEWELGELEVASEDHPIP